MKENKKRNLESNIVHRILSFLNDNSAKNNIEFDISEFILLHLEDVQNMGIEELAEACYTSSATVSRYIKKIGYRNFITFKEEIEGYNNFRMQKVQLAATNNREIVDNFLNENITLMNEFKSAIDIDNILHVVEKLKKANKVYFFGIDYSQIVAQDAQLKFINNNILSYTFVQQKKIFETVNIIKEDDIAFFITASGETKILKEINSLIASNVERVVLTENENSELAKAATDIIVVPKGETNFAICAMGERIAQLLVIDIIYLLTRHSF